MEEYGPLFMNMRIFRCLRPRQGKWAVFLCDLCPPLGRFIDWPEPYEVSAAPQPSLPCVVHSLRWEN